MSEDATLRATARGTGTQCVQRLADELAMLLLLLPSYNNDIIL